MRKGNPLAIKDWNDLVKIAAKYTKQFKPLQLIKVDQFCGWETAQKKFFADECIFGEIYGSGK